MGNTIIDEFPGERQWPLGALQRLCEDEQGAVTPQNDALLALARQLTCMNQLHSILTRINEAIVRVRDPQALYAEACRIATSVDLFRMAWVGLVDPDASILKPVAWAGAEDGYLARIRVSIGDDPEGRGPSGSAIREGRHFICEDFETDPRMGPWRAEALRRGYHSSAAFPLMLDGKVFGAFTLYGSLPHLFDAAATDLLSTLAADICFAVQSAEVERQRRAAEEHLRQAHAELEQRVQQRTASLLASERKVSEILASVTDCHYALDHDWHFTGINDHALSYFGMPREAFIGRSIWDVFPATRDSFIEDNFNYARQTHTPVDFDFHSLVVDRWAEMHAYPTDEGISVYFRDITERRRLQDQVQRQAGILELRVQERTAALAAANAQLEQHTRQLRALHEIDQAILSAGATETIAKVTLDTIRQIVPCQWASVVLFDAEAARVRRLATNEDSPVPSGRPVGCRCRPGAWRQISWPVAVQTSKIYER
jgi:PAS domain S-box-containing protein